MCRRFNSVPVHNEHFAATEYLVRNQRNAVPLFFDESTEVTFYHSTNSTRSAIDIESQRFNNPKDLKGLN